jgi:hypothetical protein
MPEQTDTAFDEWAIVDLFGHQRFAGRVRKAEFPPDFLRLDVPATPGFDGLTQLISPKAVYALTPTTKDIATAVAARCRPEPVRRFELAALESGPDLGDDPDGYDGAMS